MLRSRLNDGCSLINKIHEKLINFYEKWIKLEKFWGFVMDFMCIRCYNDHREWLMHSGNTT